MRNVSSVIVSWRVTLRLMRLLRRSRARSAVTKSGRSCSKGRLARWLYPGVVRPYGDSDLMVAPKSRARAGGVLEHLGFVEHLPWMPTPLSLDPGGTAFKRPGGGMVAHPESEGPGVEARRGRRADTDNG